MLGKIVTALKGSSSDRNIADLTFVGSVCGLYVLGQVFPSIEVACGMAGAVALGGFSYFEARCGVRPLRDLGLRSDNLCEASRYSLLVFGPLLIAATIYAWMHGIYRPAHFAIALFVYPLWGVVQQLLFQGMFLTALKKRGWGYWSIPATSFLFVLVHYPSKFLMAYTAFGAPLFSWIYYKRPNVLPLGFFHGIFGALLFYVFREKDVIGRFLNR